MRYLIVWALILHISFAAKVSYVKWEKGMSFSEYLQSRNISTSLLDSISEEDQQFLSDIHSNHEYYEAKEDDGTVLQALIPISEEMQIHLYKKREDDSYVFDIIPIEYKEKSYYGKVEIEENPYNDTLKSVNQKNVAKRVSQAMKGVVNTRKFHKGDRIDFIYKQRTRLGKVYTMPDIKVVKVQMKDKEQFVYVDEDGDGYDAAQKEVAYQVTGKKKVIYSRRVPVSQRGQVFGMPIRNARITSSFSYRRWHPILHRYRPHEGTDFGARKGTPLLAVNNGKIIYAGWMAGYGNTIKIRHSGGYVSLYAHQSKIRAKNGQSVKKGQVIGYSGNSGRSTGPHLHFGMMKNGRWIDPMKVLRRDSAVETVLKKFTKYEDVTTTKYKKVEIKGTKKHTRELLAYIDQNETSYKWGMTQLQSVNLKEREKFSEAAAQQN
ncbi:MAG: peptidoglycan DD-metalloendopeptidase family protein [Campylobacterales bacterium]|nr:peptidoglycan DD-metalloendopeptidase family protein [Campylobacterales bacterium]